MEFLMNIDDIDQIKFIHEAFGFNENELATLINDFKLHLDKDQEAHRAVCSGPGCKGHSFMLSVCSYVESRNIEKNGFDRNDPNFQYVFGFYCALIMNASRGGIIIL
jgi:hypothetical protein